MEFKQLDNKIVLLDGNQEIGSIVFSYRANHQISADHTTVNPQYQGQGLAEKLLDQLVDFAKTNGYKIIANCSYVAKKFAESEKYRTIKAD